MTLEEKSWYQKNTSVSEIQLLSSRDYPYPGSKFLTVTKTKTDGKANK